MIADICAVEDKNFMPPVRARLSSVMVRSIVGNTLEKNLAS